MLHYLPFLFTTFLDKPQCRPNAKQNRVPTALMCCLAVVHVPLGSAYKLWVLPKFSCTNVNPQLSHYQFGMHFGISLVVNQTYNFHVGLIKYHYHEIAHQS